MNEQLLSSEQRRGIGSVLAGLAVLVMPILAPRMFKAADAAIGMAAVGCFAVLLGTAMVVLGGMTPLRSREPEPHADDRVAGNALE